MMNALSVKNLVTSLHFPELPYCEILEKKFKLHDSTIKSNNIYIHIYIILCIHIHLYQHEHCHGFKHSIS